MEIEGRKKDNTFKHFMRDMIKIDESFKILVSIQGVMGGMYLPAMMIYGFSFREQDNNIVVQCEGKEYFCTIITANVYHAMWEAVPDKALFLRRYEKVFDAPLVPSKRYSEYYLDHNVGESGQLKIFSAIVDLLSQSKKRKNLRILVIGSGGESYTQCGKTYLAIAQYCEDLDLHGEMFMYDPLESFTGKVSLYPNMTMHFFSKFFDYNVPSGSYDFIFDDSYDVKPCGRGKEYGLQLYWPDEHGKVLANSCSVEIREGAHAFVIVPSDLRFELLTVNHHKEAAHFNPICGGFYTRTKNKMVIFGSSFNYGPYHPADMQRLLPYAVVCEPTKFTASDKMALLKQHYPGAVISTKCIDEGKFGRLQHFYDGPEKREYHKMWPTIEPIGCVLCSYVEQLARRGWEEEVVRSMFLFVGGCSCTKMTSVKKRNIATSLTVFAKNKTGLFFSIDNIAGNFRVKHSTVLAVLRIMLLSGQIYLDQERRFIPEQFKDGVYKNFKVLSVDPFVVGNQLGYEVQNRVVKLSLQRTNVVLPKTFNIGEKDANFLVGQISEPIKQFVGKINRNHGQKGKIVYVGNDYHENSDYAAYTGCRASDLAKYEKTHELFFRADGYLFKKKDPVSALEEMPPEEIYSKEIFAEQQQKRRKKGKLSVVNPLKTKVLGVSGGGNVIVLTDTPQ